jgi:DNA repair photolyase
VLVAPLMPGINDAPEQIAPILEAASEAGAAYVTGIALHLRGDVRGLFFEWLREHRPDLIERYKRLYRRGAYMHPDERQQLQQLVKGPDRPPGRFVRRRTQESDGEEPNQRAGHNLAWTPEQGRLF